MRFIDSIEIQIKSGRGGNGLVSFKSARNKPHLGPDGGDGGKGGDVYFVGNPGLNTLSKLRFHRLYAAEDGARGGANTRTGKGGEDLFLPVPLGTILFFEDKIVAEILSEKPVKILDGGHGGKGNIRFLRATRQAPDQCTKGGAEQEMDLRLELKVLADVGLAGLPNAGKSTLLSVVSAARPKIADYPFTTLTPQLGVVDSNDKSFVMADIPGLLEGASHGKGLGLTFLKHLERTKVIAFILDSAAYEISPLKQLKILLDELGQYCEEFLTQKNFLVVANKSDAVDDYAPVAEVEKFCKKKKMPFIFISAVQRKGLEELKARLVTLIEEKNIRDDLPPPPVKSSTEMLAIDFL